MPTRLLPRSRLVALALATVVAAILATFAVPMTAAEAAVDRDAEHDFVCRTNAERAKVGRSPLRVAADLTKVARQHSVRMANQNHLHHNPNLGSDVKNWRRAGENVGVGPSVSSLHTALMNSTGHRRNLLDSGFTEIGIGVERRGSRVWVTQVFRTPSGGTSSSLPNCGSSGSTVANTSTTTTSTTKVPSGGIPVVGDWNGNGKDTAGVFKDGTWYLTNRSGSGAERVVHFGRRGDLPLVGDWNGNGKDTIGIIRDGTWHLKNSLRGGRSDVSFSFGRVTRGDVPVVGDWNGNGKDGIGIIRDGDWHLRNRLSGGSGQIVFTYGRLTRGDVPLVGDWNRSGKDTIGIVRDGTWHLKNSLRGGRSDTSFSYGRVSRGDLVVVGDWNGNGRSGPGIVRNGTWHLKNSLRGGSADSSFGY